MTMATSIKLNPANARFVAAKVKSSTLRTADAFVNRVLREKAAQADNYARWFRKEITAGLAEAEARDFATDKQVTAVFRKWT